MARETPEKKVFRSIDEVRKEFMPKAVDSEDLDDLVDAAASELLKRSQKLLGKHRDRLD